MYYPDGKFFHCEYDSAQYKYLTLRVFTFKKGEKEASMLI